MKVALIDYGSGNLRSCQKALERAASERGTGHQIIVTSDAAAVTAAERIVLPGVGAFADCMRGIDALPGMVDALNDAVIARKVPFLGICVGMQLLARVGHEFGDHPGLGWIEGEVARIKPADPALKIPHMGWNELRVRGEHPLLSGIRPDENVYFLHSYAMTPARNADVVATADYGGTIVAAVARGNIAGMQFHPEKSQAAGITLLGNFLEWRP